MNEISQRLFDAMSQPNLVEIRKSTSFYPSSASVETIGPDGEKKVIGSCLREQYYRMTEDGYTDVGKTEYIISALQGDKNHSMIEELLEKHGFQMGLQKIAAEHSIYDPIFNISGRSDILVWDYIKNHMAGIEVKSLGEYKMGQVIDEPDDQHILQSALYLDHYTRHIPDDQVKPARWYILYVARNESYQVKRRKHGSPFEKIWDFYIELDDDKNTLVFTPNKGVIVRKDLNVKEIYKRWYALKIHLNEKTLPARDFTLSYSEEKIAGLHKVGALSRKADREAVDKWIKKGCKEGELKLELGDIECQFCAFKSKCWENKKSITPDYKLPKIKVEIKEEVNDEW